MTTETLYYVYKSGVHGHGVFWIGHDLELAKIKAEEFADNDRDDYHAWKVLEYSEANNSESPDAALICQYWKNQ